MPLLDDVPTVILWKVMVMVQMMPVAVIIRQ